MEDRKHFFEDICIPRNEFIKEHVHLLKLLKHGNRAQLLDEAKSQEAELKGKTGGSRAAGYVKKLLAMYKDGLEVFDIKKMKWASDNLKALGISMEEDEGPVGADDYSEYSPKEAEVHRKLNALAKKADREGNTAEIKAEYKQLRAKLKAEEPKKADNLKDEAPADKMTSIKLPRQVYPYTSGEKVLITEREQEQVKKVNKLARERANIRNSFSRKLRTYDHDTINAIPEVKETVKKHEEALQTLQKMMDARLGEHTKRVYSQLPPAVPTPGKIDFSRVASSDKPQHKTQTEGELLAELKVLYTKLDTKGWTDEDRKEYGRLAKAVAEERDRQNKLAEAEKPAEAVKIIEKETEDAEEKDVGKFSYNMDFFGAIDKMYTIQRNRASVRGKSVDAKLFDSIVSIQNNYDLYPTPLKSLLPIFKDITELEGRYTTPLSFLEPSAGTGNIVRSIIDFGNVKKINKIDAVEMSQDLAKLLQEQTSISNVYRQDFLTFQPKTDYHYIVMNPPYSDGNNKTFWLEHMMKAMSIAWNQVKDGGGLQCAIYIIIPTTYMDPMFSNYYKNNYGADKKYIGEEIPFDMNLCNKKKALVKEYGFYDNENDDWDAEFFLKKVGIIDDFAKIERNGTARPLNITTGIYRLLEGRTGGKKKKRSVHYNTY